MADPETPQDALAGFASFRHCSPADRSRLLALGSPVPQAAGTVLFEEGVVGHSVYVLLEGRGEARRRTPFGDLRVAEFGPGDVVGEVSFLDGKPRSSSIASLTSSRWLRLEDAVLRPEFEGDSAFAVSVLRAFWLSLARKVRAANAVMLEIMSPGQQVPQVSRDTVGQQVPLTEVTKRHALRQLGVDDAELDLLTAHARAECYPAGALIFSEGDRGDALHVVLGGKVRISRRPPGMGEEALAVLSRGEVFGEMALVDDRPRSADARAHTGGCTVLSLHREHLVEVFRESPESARQFLDLMCRLLCRRLRSMTDLLVAWRVMSGFG